MNRIKLINKLTSLKGKKNPYELYLKITAENQTLSKLQKFQLEQFRIIFDYSKNYVPYYKQIFNDLRLNAKDFRSLKDLEAIPLLDKKTIVDNLDSFLPSSETEEFIYGSTGGSTGEPLKYRLGATCNTYNAAIQMRGFSYAGYHPYDKILTLAGGSLIKTNHRSFKKMLNDLLYNRRAFTSFGVGRQELNKFLAFYHSYQPKFLRGYANSLILLSEFISENKIKLNHRVDAIFSTAEMLNSKQRELIETIFNCKVYDQYGLNDGGASAFEDNSHNGFLIDTERAILEATNEQGQPLMEQTGELVTTSLHNYAFPFIRYKTNDIGIITSRFSTNFSPRLRLTNLGGRSTDVITINNKNIGSPVLTVLMGKIDVTKYQFVQRKNTLTLIMKPLPAYNKEQEQFIKKSLTSNLGDFQIHFDYSGRFIDTKNKHKFIIKEKL